MVKPSALLHIAGPYVHDYYNPCQRTCNTTGVYGVWRKENIMNNTVFGIGAEETGVRITSRDAFKNVLYNTFYNPDYIWKKVLLFINEINDPFVFIDTKDEKVHFSNFAAKASVHFYVGQDGYEFDE